MGDVSAEAPCAEFHKLLASARDWWRCSRLATAARKPPAQVWAILARTSLATAASSATRPVSWGHQASATEHGGRSRIGTKVTPGRLYQRPTASDVMLSPTPVETRCISASSVLASATTGAGPDR